MRRLYFVLSSSLHNKLLKNTRRTNVLQLRMNAGHYIPTCAYIKCANKPKERRADEGGNA
jgi:hypothetical protein